MKGLSEKTSMFMSEAGVLTEPFCPLAQREKSIRPDYYGNFSDDEHYSQVLNLFHSLSSELKCEKAFFLEKIMPQISQYENLLDVGIGKGDLLTEIGNKFKRITMVEKSQFFLDHISSTDFVQNVELNKINANIQEVKLPPFRYNLAILSHVLYYIDRSQWLDVVQNIYHSLSFNGIMVIAFSAGFSKDHIAAEFGGKQFNARDLIETCKNAFPQCVNVSTTKGFLCSKDLDTILQICGLYLNDACTSASRSDLVRYANKNLRWKVPFFRITAEQFFIVIKKKAVAN